MPTAAEHQEKADSHLRLLSQIGDEFPDWLATVGNAQPTFLDCARDILRVE
jgi:hypothetical protein